MSLRKHNSTEIIVVFDKNIILRAAFVIDIHHISLETAVESFGSENVIYIYIYEFYFYFTETPITATPFV